MIESAQYIIDNYNFVSERELYKCNHGNLLIEGPNYFLEIFFNRDFFNIEGTGETQYSFGNSEYNKWLETSEEPQRVSMETALAEDKNIILSYNLHPRIDKDDIRQYRTNFFDKIFSDIEILEGVKTGKITLFLYFGYEADNFYSFDESVMGNYSKIFNEVIKDYNLPKNAIIILSSNLMGPDLEKEYVEHTNEEIKFGVIYANVCEIEAFKSVKGTVDPDYTFDDYIENVKKSKKTLLRINRTHSVSRDIMLWYLYTSKNLDKAIIEHQKMLNQPNIFAHELEKFRNICELSGKDYLKKYFEWDMSLYNKINSNLPIIASSFEKNNELPMGDVFSNEPIPHDVYENTILSWVSTSLAYRNDQVFINASTFNPILNYHPIIYTGNYKTVHYLKQCGFRGYNFLYDEESVDNKETEFQRLVLSIDSIENILKLSKDELVNLLIENRQIMEDNRKVLFECRSIYTMLVSLTDLLKSNKKEQEMLNII